MSEGTTVLVVDDEPTIVEVYELALSKEYEVLTATGGEEALAVVDETVDVVLLDRRMPDRSGDEVLAELRERGLGCRVAMVTAVDPDFDIADMPFDTYVTKPASGSELRATVEQLRAIDEYDEHVRELYSAVESRAALEAEKTENELAASDAYRDLTERVRRLREQSELATDDMDHESFVAALSTLPDDG